MKKIEKISNVIFIILRVLQIISIAVAILCGVVCIVELFYHPLSISISIDLGYVSLEVVEEIIPTILSSQTFLMFVLIMCIIILCVTFMVLQVLCKIFDSMRKGHPFEKSMSSNIRKIALLVLCGGTIYEVLKNVSIAYLANMINITDILLNEYIRHVYVDTKFNALYIIFAILLWLIAYVFDYGAILQREADETL